MNRIKRLFEEKKERVLNLYFTAGFPNLDSTESIIHSLADAGADIIELGMPYSDPLADGETIQRSSSIALKNGMQLDILFDQVKQARQSTQIPIMLMGYFNQVIQYGKDRFFDNCQSAGIDGLIIPDIPLDYFETHLKDELITRNLAMTFLVTPETSDQRIKQADELSTAFLYVVSKSSITGNIGSLSDDQSEYFKRIDGLGLHSPRLVGFGIHDKDSFDKAALNANGAIIGSAFIRYLEREGTESIHKFVHSILKE